MSRKKWKSTAVLVATIVAVLRQRLGGSGRFFAALCGVSEHTVRRWETDPTPVDLRRASGIGLAGVVELLQRYWEYDADIREQAEAILSLAKDQEEASGEGWRMERRDMLAEHRRIDHRQPHISLDERDLPEDGKPRTWYYIRKLSLEGDFRGCADLSDAAFDEFLAELLERRDRNRVLLWQGASELRLGRFEEAEDTLRRTELRIGEDANDEDRRVASAVKANLGTLRQFFWDFEAAFHLFEESAALDPRSCVPAYNMMCAASQAQSLERLRIAAENLKARFPEITQEGTFLRNSLLTDPTLDWFRSQPSIVRLFDIEDVEAAASKIDSADKEHARPVNVRSVYPSRAFAS